MIGFRPSGSGFIDVNMVFPPSSPGGDSEVVSEDDEVEMTMKMKKMRKMKMRRGKCRLEGALGPLKFQNAFKQFQLTFIKNC